MRATRLILVLLALPSASVLATEVQPELEKADVDQSGTLDRQEAVGFYKAVLAQPDDEDVEESAADFAEDLLSWRCSACAEIPLDQASRYLHDRTERERRNKALEARKSKIGWAGLGFSRFIVDAANPRPAKYSAPTIFSYRHDSKAEDKDQFNALGGVQLLQVERDLDPKGHGTRLLSFTVGIDFDVDGSKKASETTISAGVPLFYTWLPEGGPFESLTLGIKPKFVTDRAFNREVFEGVFSFAFSAPSIQAGFIWPPKRSASGELSPVSVFWQPSIDVETGEVRDAAGNEKLAPLEEQGTYVRVVPRVGFILYPWKLSERLRLVLDYFHRFDVDQGWNRGYGEARLDYDLVIDGALELSLVYRNGRKPPDFTEKDELLLGIGIRQ